MNWQEAPFTDFAAAEWGPAGDACTLIARADEVLYVARQTPQHGRARRKRSGDGVSLYAKCVIQVNVQ